MTSQMEGGNTARRALRLLEALAATGPYQSLDELGEATGLSKSTAYRLLRVLQDESYVDRAEHGGYRLGSRLIGLAAAALPQLDLYATVRPQLRELAQLSGETVTLHRRAGDLGILVLAAENEAHSLRRVARIGEASQLVRGCSGLVILANLDDEDRGGVIERRVPPSDRAALGERLGDIRHRGYASSAGENHPGVNGMAVAIAATNGTALATSIAVSGPADRWTRQRMAEFARELRRAADDLSTLFDLEAGGAFVAAGDRS